ncbi:SDR family oxidoreductase [Lacibacterium aquatile]|uniref:SDR family oxidoreductase n=1 Tax=Lacibacterium aquatile TaxID=1168082 RepID=A0ABW5DVQ8_9PROT
MSILIIGGTGVVGREILRTLSKSGLRARVLMRDPQLDLPLGMEAVKGDLSRPNTLEPALQGVSRVFLLNALTQDETQQGLNAVAAAKQANVRRIVYLSVHRCHEALHIPHFATKQPVVAAIKASGMEWSILEPNNFFQNDGAFFTHAIAGGGVYPQPLGSVGISRVDTRDIAEAAVNCLTRDGFTDRHWPLVGPEALTGARIAAAYTRLLGRKVQYAGDNLDAWDMAFKPFLPDWLRHDFRIMYEHFQARGLKASAEDLAACRWVVGHPPRSFDDYLHDVFLPIAERLTAPA